MKYGTMVKKDITIEELVKRFSALVGRPPAKLTFAIVHFNEIEEFIREESFRRKLDTLRIRESETLYIYEEKSVSEYAGKHLPPVQKQRKERPFPYNLKPGDLADIFMWTEWQHCVFLSLDETTHMVKCETLEG